MLQRHPERACRVLIVDDDQQIRALLASILHEEGFESAEAGNGAEALDQIARTRYSVILLDLDMPVMDGRTFYARMVDQGEPSPTVIVSAHGARSAARELGAAASFDKPFDIERVSEVVVRLCRTTRPEVPHGCKTAPP